MFKGYIYIVAVIFSYISWDK